MIPLIYQPMFASNAPFSEVAMTTLAFPARFRATPRLKAIGHFFADITQGIHDAREIENRYETLSRMSDEALACRGLTRDDVPLVAVTGSKVS